MTNLPQLNRPAWVIEQSLDWNAFNCCGDQNPYPLQCQCCHYPVVICGECDTLYADLPDTDARSPFQNECRCPKCDVVIIGGVNSRITFAQWSSAGLDSLLDEPEIGELIRSLYAFTDRIAEWLLRGMRSTARTHGRIFTELAESLIHIFPNAETHRVIGTQFVIDGSLKHVIEQCNAISDDAQRTYTILGVVDALTQRGGNAT